MRIVASVHFKRYESPDEMLAIAIVRFYYWTINSTAIDSKSVSAPQRLIYGTGIR